MAAESHEWPALACCFCRFLSSFSRSACIFFMAFSSFFCSFLLSGGLPLLAPLYAACPCCARSCASYIACCCCARSACCCCAACCCCRYWRAISCARRVGVRRARELGRA